MQLDTGLRLHAPAHLFPQAFQIGGGGGAGVDQEVAMFLRNLCAADGETPAARGIDQLPGLAMRRVGEGASPRARSDRLALGPRVLDLGDARLDRLAGVGTTLELGA